MNKSKGLKKTAEIGFALTTIAVLLAGCGGGGGGVAAAKTNFGGLAFKGDFDPASTTVTACPLTVAVANSTAKSCAGAPTSARGTMAAGGAYTLGGVTWSGATLVHISGLWKNEALGNALSPAPGSLTSVVILPAVGTPVPPANVNIATAMAATALLNNVAAGGSIPDAAGLAVAKSAAMSALGLTGDPDALSNTGPMSTASWMFADILKAGGNPADLADALAADLRSGTPLGSTPASGVNGYNSAALSTALTNAVSATSFTVVDPTILRGFGIAPTFTAGVSGALATCTISTAGTATCNGVASAATPILSFSVADLTDAAGTGAASATSYATGLSFTIADVATSRVLNASVLADLTTDGLGGVTLSVPASAVMSFNGTDSTGAAVNGTVTNLSANTFTATSGVVSIDVGQLVTTAQTRVPGVSSLVTLTRPGTYDVKVGVNGSIGLLGAPMAQLFPLSTIGRTIRATITTQ